MNKYGYARVSTEEQITDRQVNMLLERGIHERMIFTDKSTGKNFNRPEYQALKAMLKPGDILTVTSIDRLGRNKQQTVDEIRELKKIGVRLQILNIPTTLNEFTEENAQMLDMVSNILIEVYMTFAEQELATLKDRQRKAYDALPVNELGRKVSKKTGRQIGRPNVDIKKGSSILVDSWIKGDLKLADCIEETGLSRATLYRIKKERTTNE
ncbi:MAG: recombinase family protein [Paraclostridium sp.]